jgi:hypothetical protein
MGLYRGPAPDPVGGRQDEITGLIGAWFVAANQAFFMGLFLLISAYFVPGSYDRKGAGRFLKDRLIRLGIPLVVYSWIIDPLLGYVRQIWLKGLRMPTWGDLLGHFRGGALIGSGPLWFVDFPLQVPDWCNAGVRLLRILLPTFSASSMRPSRRVHQGEGCCGRRYVAAEGRLARSAACCALAY